MELLDIYDAKGNLTAKKKDRSIVHRQGLWHKTVHIWILNSRNELLIQKRSAQKDSHPNLWDISAAGHITSGDTVIAAGLRELKEELGLKVRPSELQFLFTAKQQYTQNNGSFIHNAHHDIYLLKKDLDLTKIKLQKEEVSAVKFITIAELKQHIKQKNPAFVPHADEYKKLFAYLETPRIILASESIGRRQLMQKLGVPFEIQPSGYHEDMSKHRSPAKLAVFLAEGKAEFIAKANPNSIIIGGDTFLTLGGNKIGKPKSIADAKAMIAKMSNKTIQVHSGVALVKTDSTGHIIAKKSAHVLTKITLKKVTAAEIDFLAHQPDALKISGAFSIEGSGSTIIKKINGDYDSVIGLPVFKVKEFLDIFLST